MVVDVSTLTGDHTVEIIAEPGGFETTLKVVNDDPKGLSFEADVGGERGWLTVEL